MKLHKSIISLLIVLLTIIGCNNPTAPEKSSQSGSALFVLEAGSQTVSRIRLDTSAVSLNFALTGDIPADIVTSDQNLLILNSTPPSLSVLDARTGEKITTVNLPPHSNPYAILPRADAIYVSGWSSNHLYKLDATDFSMVDSIEVGVNPQGIAASEEYLFVANSGGYPDYAASSVSVINQSDFSMVKSIPTGINPQNFAWAPNGTLHLVCTGNYVDVFGQADIIDIENLSVSDSVMIGGSPGYIAITDGGAGYLSAFGDGQNGFLYKYDTATGNIIHGNTNPIRVNKGAMDLAFSSNRSRLFIANYSDATVQSLDVDNNTVETTYTVNDGPQNLVLWEE